MIRRLRVALFSDEPETSLFLVEGLVANESHYIDVPFDAVKNRAKDGDTWQRAIERVLLEHLERLTGETDATFEWFQHRAMSQEERERQVKKRDEVRKSARTKLARAARLTQEEIDTL